MRSRKIQPALLVIMSLTILLSAVPVLAGEGEGRVRVGYVYVDNQASLGVNQETFNTYEGFDLSFEQFRYRFDDGIELTANLSHLTINDRNLTASLSKYGKYRLTVHNDQYRRQYDPDGLNFTRRRTTYVKGSVNLIKAVEFYGAYRVTDRAGHANDALPETIDREEIDYRQKSCYIGSRLRSDWGRLQFEYGQYDFSDHVSGPNHAGRKADVVKLSGSGYCPKYQWLQLSGGYNYRRDQTDRLDGDLSTNLGWFGVKLFLPNGFMGDYRLVYGRTEQDALDQETDNATNTLAFGKTWKGRGGVRVGYENRVVDDLIDRTESDGLLISCWYNWQKRVFLRAMVALRDDDVVRGSTLMGDEDVTRQQYSVRYVHPTFGDLMAQYSGQLRKHGPGYEALGPAASQGVSSSADYDTFNSSWRLRLPEYGRVELGYTYRRGQFENTMETVGYEFSDHVFRASLHPLSYRGLEASGRAKYYRCYRDQDLEKFSLGITAEYAINTDYRVGAAYDVYNFDDYLSTDGFYTGNIVNLYFTRALAL